MRSATEVDAEEWVLTSSRGQALLAEVGRVARPRPAELARWRRDHSAEEVAAALRLADARRRGAAKFTRADRMWLDPVGLEQATAEPVARHKTTRFRHALVADLCSGVGGDALALASQARVLAVDADPGMCRRLRWNAGIYEVSERLAVVRGRADTFPIPPGALVHIDPDRRARAARRAQSVEDYEPGLPFLRSLIHSVAGGAIKLGPASDFTAHFSRDGIEIELISLDGECKEATVWFGALATARRRATVLPEGVSWTDRDEETGPLAPVRDVSRWVFDPDPALSRSGLVYSFARAHGLARCAAGIDYLTADERVDSPFITAFAVHDVLPMDLKRLKRAVAERRLGPLEIKVRGLDARPEELRAQLRPPGPNPATLLLIGGAGAVRAVIAKRS